MEFFRGENFFFLDILQLEFFRLEVFFCDNMLIGYSFAKGTFHYIGVKAASMNTVQNSQYHGYGNP